MRTRNIAVTGPGVQTGFNLIELMVAMVIGIFLIAGTLSVYQESQSAILVSERMARMQETARYAINLIEEDVRATGLWGQLNTTEFVAGRALPADPVTIAVTTDCEPNWTVNLARPIEGSNNANLYPNTCMNGVDYSNNTDVLVLRHVDERDLTPADLNAGGLYMRSDQSHAEIFSGTTLPGGFSATAQINALAPVAYFISNSSDNDPDLPSLRRVFVDETGVTPRVTTAEVISGVEDMQVQYGVDLNGDGSANSYVNADGVADLETVVALRLWLRLRTAREELGFEDDMVWEYADRRYTATATTATTDDAFRRTVVSKTIELRNRRTAIVEAT